MKSVTYMLDAVIKSDTFGEFLEVIYSVVEESKLKITKTGITAKAMDAAHIAMVDASLSAEAFEKYTVEECEIGVSINKLREVVKLARAEDSISIAYDGKMSSLKITIGNLVRDMSLINPSSISDAKMPSLELIGSVIVGVNDLKQAIRGSESISDHISLMLDKTGFSIGSEGDSADKLNMKIETSELKALNAPDVIKSMYPIDYFSNMVKCIKSTDYVNIFFSSNYPLRMEFNFAGDKGAVRYLLAPRTSD